MLVFFYVTAVIVCSFSSITHKSNPFKSEETIHIYMKNIPQ